MGWGNGSIVEKHAKIAEEIKRTMEHAEDWERRKTSIPGIFLVKMPDKNFRIMLLFNPPDSAGNPSKKKGLFFADSKTIKAAREAFPDPRIDTLVAAVEKLNLESGHKVAEDEEVLQI